MVDHRLHYTGTVLSIKWSIRQKQLEIGQSDRRDDIINIERAMNPGNFQGILQHPVDKGGDSMETEEADIGDKSEDKRPTRIIPMGSKRDRGDCDPGRGWGV